MKKFIKNLLIALILVPALFLVTACGENNTNSGNNTDGGGDGGNGNGTNITQTEQQKYEVLLATIGKMTQKGSYTTVSLSEDNSTTTRTIQTLNDGEWETVGEPNVDTYNEKSKNVQSLNAETGEYLENSYEYVEATNETPESWELNLEDGEYIVKAGTAEQPLYIHYYEYYGDMQAEYVSPDHAIHAFGFASANMDMSSMVNGETFAKAVENILTVVPMFTGMSRMGISEDTHVIVTTPTSAITVNDGNYSLQIDITISATPKAPQQIALNVPATATQSTTVEGSLEFAITYTSEEITGYSSSMQMNSTTVTETETSKSTIARQSSNYENAQITYSYTATEMPNDFGSLGDEIEKRLVYAQLYLDGESLVGNGYPWGEDVTTDILSALEQANDYYAYENTTIDGWYYDAACTQRVQATDTFNFKSWENPKLYAKSVPNEGYALFVINYGYTLGEQDAEMARMIGEDVAEDGFMSMQSNSYAVAVETGSFELPTTYRIWGETLNVLKVTIDRVVATENLTNLEDGHVYHINVYLEVDEDTFLK